MYSQIQGRSRGEGEPHETEKIRGTIGKKDKNGKFKRPEKLQGKRDKLERKIYNS